MADPTHWSTPGEVVHPNIHGNAALKIINAQPTLDEKIELAARLAPGGAKIAGIAADANDATSQEFRMLNHAILRQDDEGTGAERGIRYQILPDLSTIPEAILSHSQTLNAAHLRQAEAVTVNGGARIFNIVQIHYDDNGNFKDLHVVPVLHPRHPKDGAPWFVEPGFNLWDFAGTNKDALARAYAHLNLTISRTAEPATGFERLQANTPIDRSLGTHGTILAAPFADGEMLTVNIAREAFDNRIRYDNQCVIEFDIPQNVYQRFAATRRMIDLSHQHHEAASLGDISGGSNCVIAPTRLLLGGDVSSVPPNKPLHETLIGFTEFELFRNGNGIVRWTDNRGLDAKDFFDDPTRIPPVEKSVFEQKIRSLIDQPSAKKYQTQFCTVGKRHPDPEVHALYELQRQLALEKLREMAPKPITAD